MDGSRICSSRAGDLDTLGGFRKSFNATRARSGSKLRDGSKSSSKRGIIWRIATGRRIFMFKSSRAFSDVSFVVSKYRSTSVISTITPSGSRKILD